MTTRTKWTRKQIARTGGQGDRILITTNDPAEGWYWSELGSQRGFYNFGFHPKPGIFRINHGLIAVSTIIGPEIVEHDHVLIEPNVKRTFSADNKDWGFANWQELVDTVPLRFLQCVPTGSEQRVLERVDVLHTRTFDHAVAAMSIARGIVTTAGGLHHAAAAIKKPAVVIWGSHAPPEVLGYGQHANIAEPDAAGLGWRHTHPACIAAMRRTSVKRVAEAVMETFG